MKPQLLTSVLALSALTLAATFTASPSRAQKALTNSFVCGRSNGVPATLARTVRGDIPVIRWESDFFPGWPPEKRCQEVSPKFQE